MFWILFGFMLPVSEADFHTCWNTFSPGLGWLQGQHFLVHWGAPAAPTPAKLVEFDSDTGLCSLEMKTGELTQGTGEESVVVCTVSAEHLSAFRRTVFSENPTSIMWVPKCLDTQTSLDTDFSIFQLFNWTHKCGMLMLWCAHHEDATEHIHSAFLVFLSERLASKSLPESVHTQMAAEFVAVLWPDVLSPLSMTMVQTFGNGSVWGQPCINKDWIAQIVHCEKAGSRIEDCQGHWWMLFNSPIDGKLRGIASKRHFSRLKDLEHQVHPPAPPLVLHAAPPPPPLASYAGLSPAPASLTPDSVCIYTQLDSVQAYLYCKAYRISSYCGLSASIHKQILATECTRLSGWYHQWDPVKRSIFYFDPATDRACWTCPTSSLSAPAAEPHVESSIDIHGVVRHQAAIVHPLRRAIAKKCSPSAHTSSPSYILVGHSDWLEEPPPTNDSALPQMPYWLCERQSTEACASPICATNISVRRLHPVVVWSHPHCCTLCCPLIECCSAAQQLHCLDRGALWQQIVCMRTRCTMGAFGY